MLIDQIRILVENGPLDEKEILYYIAEIKKRSRGKTLKSITFRLADDYMDLRYSFQSFPFERIRRVAAPVAYAPKRCTG